MLAGKANKTEWIKSISYEGLVGSNMLNEWCEAEAGRPSLIHLPGSHQVVTSGFLIGVQPNEGFSLTLQSSEMQKQESCSPET